MSPPVMAASASTGSIQEAVVTLEASTTTGSCLTSTTLATSARQVATPDCGVQQCRAAATMLVYPSAIAGAYRTVKTLTGVMTVPVLLQVGMRYFNKRTNKYHSPIVNLDKLWTLVGDEVRMHLLRTGSIIYQ